jgi:hypothetical protein
VIDVTLLQPWPPLCGDRNGTAGNGLLNNETGVDRWQRKPIRFREPAGASKSWLHSHLEPWRVAPYGGIPVDYKDWLDGGGSSFGQQMIPFLRSGSVSEPSPSAVGSSLCVILEHQSTRDFPWLLGSRTCKGLHHDAVL